MAVDPVDDLSSTSDSRWFVAYTKPHRERAAQVQLGLQDFATFLPLRTATIRHARRLTDVHRPLFPRYVFVSLDLGRDRWRSVNGTYNVIGLIMGGERPLPVPRGIVEALVQASDRSGRMRFGADLRVGQRVKLGVGPFADLIGELERLDDRGRVRVLLEIMGATVPVWTDADGVMPAI